MKASQSRWPHALRAFRHPNFRLFWFGQLASLIGVWMQTVTLNWLLYQMTDSATVLGLVGFAVLLPAGLASLVSGVISDRFSPRHLLVVVEIILAVQALVLAVLSWNGAIKVWHIVMATLVMGLGNAIERPICFALLMELAGRADFANAVGLNSSVVNLSQSIGSAFAGILIGSMGESSCFFINFVTYLVVILSLLLMRVQAQRRCRKPLRLKSDLLDGARYVLQSQAIKALLIVIAVASVLSRPHILLMPVFARDILRISSEGYGFLMSSVGVGSIIGAMIAAGLRRGHRGRWLVGISLVIPMLLIPFAFSKWLLVSAGLLLLVSIGQLAQLVVASSLLQLTSSDEFHGRVTSFMILLNNGLTRFGGVQAGIMAEHWGASVAVSTGALLSLACMLLIFWWLPVVRRLQ